MLKKLVSYLIFLLLFAQSSLSWAAVPYDEVKVLFQEIGILYQNKELNLNSTPILHQNRLYVPLRELAEALGFEIAWDQESSQVILLPPSLEKILEPTDPWKGEEFIYGQVMKIDYENRTLYVEQHLDDNSREIFESLVVQEDAIILLKRNTNHWQVTLQDVKVGDGVGMVITRTQEIRGIIVDL